MCDEVSSRAERRKNAEHDIAEGRVARDPEDALVEIATIEALAHEDADILQMPVIRLEHLGSASKSEMLPGSFTPRPCDCVTTNFFAALRSR
jgi:hypothetical protein